MLHDKNGHKVDEKGELVFDEQCHNCDAKIPMPLIEQEITEFEKIIDNLPSRIGETPKNIVVDAFRASLIRFTRSVIEESMPEEKKSYYGCITHRGLNGMDCDVCKKSVDENNKQICFNTCRTQLRENVEGILKDNEKEV